MNNQNIIYLKKELIKINNYFRERKFNLVIKKSKLLLKTNPKQPMIYNLIGFSHLELGETKKALENFLLAIEKIPSDPSIFCNTGIAYKQYGNLKKAREYFNKALNCNSKHISSHINLAHLENKLRHSQQATKHYLDAYNINNNSEEVLTYYILNLSSIGNFSEAKKIISELNNKFPNNTKSYQLFSKIHKYKTGDPHQNFMMNKVKVQNLNKEDKANLYFALAKSFSDQNNIEKFVDYTLKANEIKFESINEPIWKRRIRDISTMCKRVSERFQRSRSPLSRLNSFKKVRQHQNYGFQNEGA